jgi:hypothetical protein
VFDLDGSMPFLTFYTLDVYINREFKAVSLSRCHIICPLYVYRITL